MPNHPIGVLLVNLGTPNSPHPEDVHRYLTEFLTDPRVIDVSWIKRQLLVRSVIVPFRYKTSAKAYKHIWTAEGSPLLVYGKRLKEELQKSLGDQYVVELAMRYQNPSIEKALDALLKFGVSKLIVLPLFPQYASATTGSVHQRVMELLSRRTVIPKISFIDHFYDHPAFIDAFTAVSKRHSLKEYDHVLFSFHGLPQRQITKADKSGRCLMTPHCCDRITSANGHCYSAQCYATAAAIAHKLEIPRTFYTVCFQSRLGKEPWLEPAISQTLKNCLSRKNQNILVFCPSFVCDCLETLYEIGVEYADEFKTAGGTRLTLVEGLNDHPAWLEGLKNIITHDTK